MRKKIASADDAILMQHQILLPTSQGNERELEGDLLMRSGESRVKADIFLYIHVFMISINFLVLIEIHVL